VDDRAVMASLAPEWPAAMPSSFDRIAAVRDRLLASMRFQRWAARFPLTRPIARRRARALFDLCAGFVYSQVLLACVRLRVCEIVFEAPLGRDELAARMGLPADAAQRLLDAAVSLRLLAHRSGDRYGIGPLGAALVGNPGIAAMVAHHALLYADLADPEALLRGAGRPAAAHETALGRYWAYATAEAPTVLSAAQVADYTALMAASQPLVADEVLDAYRLDRHRHLLDVGGGDGTFLCAAARRAPRLHLTLFDLPPVAAQAQDRLARDGLAGRATAIGGDFLVDELPRGADLISLVRVIHDHDDAAALCLLRAARRALPPGGTVLLAEPMSGTAGAAPIADAYFAFYLLAMGSGRPRSADALAALLRAAGFDRVRLLRTSQPMLVRVLLARVGPMTKTVSND
jgi:demethylspheroidene O-methyltransferase